MKPVVVKQLAFQEGILVFLRLDVEGHASFGFQAQKRTIVRVEYRVTFQLLGQQGMEVCLLKASKLECFAFMLVSIEMRNLSGDFSRGK